MERLPHHDASSPAVVASPEQSPQRCSIADSEGSTDSTPECPSDLEFMYAFDNQSSSLEVQCLSARFEREGRGHNKDKKVPGSKHQKRLEVDEEKDEAAEPDFGPELAPGEDLEQAPGGSEADCPMLPNPESQMALSEAAAAAACSSSSDLFLFEPEVHVFEALPPSSSSAKALDAQSRGRVSPRGVSCNPLLPSKPLAFVATDSASSSSPLAACHASSLPKTTRQHPAEALLPASNWVAASSSTSSSSHLSFAASSAAKCTAEEAWRPGAKQGTEAHFHRNTSTSTSTSTTAASTSTTTTTTTKALTKAPTMADAGSARDAVSETAPTTSPAGRDRGSTDTTRGMALEFPSRRVRDRVPERDLLRKRESALAPPTTTTTIAAAVEAPGADEREAAAAFPATKDLRRAAGASATAKTAKPAKTAKGAATTATEAAEPVAAVEAKTEAVAPTASLLLGGATPPGVKQKVKANAMHRAGTPVPTGKAVSRRSGRAADLDGMFGRGGSQLPEVLFDTSSLYQRKPKKATLPARMCA